MFAVLIYGGNRMAGRQLRQLDTAAEQEGAYPNKKGVGPPAHECGEGGIDLRASAGIDDLHLQSDGADSRFQFFQCGLRSPGISRIDEHGNTNDSR